MEEEYVSMINDTEREKQDFYHYGHETQYITRKQVEELLNGKMIAMHINDGEYGAFIQLKD